MSAWGCSVNLHELNQLRQRLLELSAYRKTPMTPTKQESIAFRSTRRMCTVDWPRQSGTEDMRGVDGKLRFRLAYVIESIGLAAALMAHVRRSAL